jgi:hypothetical protein
MVPPVLKWHLNRLKEDGWQGVNYDDALVVKELGMKFYKNLNEICFIYSTIELDELMVSTSSQRYKATCIRHIRNGIKAVADEIRKEGQISDFHWQPYSEYEMKMMAKFALSKKINLEQLV